MGTKRERAEQAEPGSCCSPGIQAGTNLLIYGTGHVAQSHLEPHHFVMCNMEIRVAAEPRYINKYIVFRTMVGPSGFF